MGSYKDLEIYKMSFNLAIKVHQLTMTLPKHELYEQGSQVRRSAQSIKDNIAEGFGRRRYKAEYIRFLIFAHASCDEAINQLEMINTLYFTDHPINDLIRDYNILGGKINRFIQYVETNWNTNPHPITRTP
jgi:four helix bundle protein